MWQGCHFNLDFIYRVFDVMIEKNQEARIHIMWILAFLCL